MDAPGKAWHVFDAGKSYGPLTAEQVFRAVRTGRFSTAALIRADGKDEWLALGKVDVFAEALAAARANGRLIRFQCTCNNQIAVPAAHAGKQAKCNACGKVLTIPSAAAPSAPSRHASGATVLAAEDAPPPGPPRAEESPAAVPVARPAPPSEETTLWQGRPSLAHLLAGCLWAGLWLALWCVLAALSPGILRAAQREIPRLLPEAEPYVNSPHVKTVYLTGLLAALAAWAGWRLLSRLFRYLGTHYLLSTHRAAVRTGLLRRRLCEIELSGVRNVIVKRPLAAKILGYANVRLRPVDRLLRQISLPSLPGGSKLPDCLRAAVDAAKGGPAPAV